MAARGRRMSDETEDLICTDLSCAVCGPPYPWQDAWNRWNEARSDGGVVVRRREDSEFHRGWVEGYKAAREENRHE